MRTIGLSGERRRGLNSVRRHVDFALADADEAARFDLAFARAADQLELSEAERGRVLDVLVEVDSKTLAQRPSMIARALRGKAGAALNASIAACAVEIARPGGVSEVTHKRLIQCVRDVAEEAPEEPKILLSIVAVVMERNGLRLNGDEGLFSTAGAELMEEMCEAIVFLEATGLIKDRALAMRRAVLVWEESYALGLGDDGAMVYALDRAARLPDPALAHSDVEHFRSRGEAYAPSPVEVEDLRLRFASLLVFLGKWAHGAFPILQTSHTFAAALMCTDVYPEVLAGARPPWGALRVVVPNRILPIVDQELLRLAVERTGERLPEAEISHLDLVALDSGPCTLSGYCAEGYRVFLVEGGDLAGALTNRVRTGEPWRDRLALLSQRLVAGLLLAMEARPEVAREKKVAAKRATSARDRGEPGHRLVTVGAPLKVDARPAVATFLAGEKGPSRVGGTAGPSKFQVLVRGHFRNQAHGERRLKRRVMWIEPFWRGLDADAPILSRPKVLG